MCISFLSSGQVTVEKKCRKKLSAFPRLQSSKIALNKWASGSPMTNISVNCAFFSSEFIMLSVRDHCALTRDPNKQAQSSLQNKVGIHLCNHKMPISKQKLRNKEGMFKNINNTLIPNPM